MEALHMANWQCPASCCKQHKSGNTNTPVRPCNVGAPEDDCQSNVTSRAKKKDQRSCVRDVQPLDSEDDCHSDAISFVKKDDESRFTQEMQLFRSEIAAMRQEISNINSHFEKLSHAVAGLNKRIDSLGHRVYTQRLGVGGIFERSQYVEWCQSSRVIVSVECVSVRRMTDKSGSGGPGQSRAMVMRLTRLVLSAARRALDADTAGFDVPSPSRRFYINERITNTNRQLFHKPRQEGSRLNWKYIWIRNCRIYARRLPDSQPYRVRSAADLVKIFDKAKNRQKPAVFIQGDQMERVSKSRNLELLMDESLRFENHIAEVARNSFYSIPIRQQSNGKCRKVLTENQLYSKP
ncbi:hypothetical protein EVAR_28244_1 [Eumeta japonica]|uniref:FP protein C-terminal domain-containing protein n=1 Tax=Eumeta variegata TaxID=151549 RepID=A0A4C1V6H1_EUMVA|nr:hypothetical protein EVAR_28244_1 [Eumeta japonica]